MMILITIVNWIIFCGICLFGDITVDEVMDFTKMDDDGDIRYLFLLAIITIIPIVNIIFSTLMNVVLL